MLSLVQPDGVVLSVQVKIKNRSGSDQSVEILPFQDCPSVLEVKSALAVQTHSQGGVQHNGRLQVGREQGLPGEGSVGWDEEFLFFDKHLFPDDMRVLKKWWQVFCISISQINVIYFSAEFIII